MTKRPPLDIEVTVRDLIRDIPRLGFTIMKMRVKEGRDDMLIWHVLQKI